MSTFKEISWFTLPGLGVSQGYGNAAINIIRSLEEKNIKVSFNTETPRCHISFAQPDWYAGFAHQYKVGYTPWESTVIPETWKEKMSFRDAMWTTSKFCQDVYKSYGVDSVVVPHGIDSEIFTIRERTLVNKFVFLHIGEPVGRKGGQMVVDAFTDLFDDRDDVVLVMKASGHLSARWRKEWIGPGRNDYKEYYGNAAKHPKIKSYTTEISDEDMAALYHSAHCLVYPTNGEGFGLIPFNALATGLPTICTNLTGTADFAEMSMPLDAKWGPGSGVHIGDWAVPDRDHLRQLMLHVVDNWEDEQKKSIHAARIIHSKYKWSDIATQIEQLLGDHVICDNSDDM